MSAGGVLAPGDELLLRYLYNDGSLQVAMPLRVLRDTPELTVGWLAPGTPVVYRATADGTGPRETPLGRRFR